MFRWKQAMPHSSLAIANEFIRRAEGVRPLTHMQLQKLVYLAHGWSLGAFDEPLIEDDVEAWDFGPVIRRLYDALRRYGRSFITKRIHWGDDTLFRFDNGEEATAELTDDERGIIDLVWTKYGHYPAFKLSALTHQDGTPWTETYTFGRNGVIDNQLIKGHFQKLMGAA
jgi:uncharacterized phage-associated protein